jgi:Ni,Fe-hydrogenase I small subunit
MVFKKGEKTDTFNRPEGFNPRDQDDQDYNKVKFKKGQMREDFSDPQKKAGRPVYSSPPPRREQP